MLFRSLCWPAMSINRSMDIAGQQSATDQAFVLHQLCHAHNLQQFGDIMDTSSMNVRVRAKGATTQEAN